MECLVKAMDESRQVLKYITIKMENTTGRSVKILRGENSS